MAPIFRYRISRVVARTVADRDATGAYSQASNSRLNPRPVLGMEMRRLSAAVSVQSIVMLAGEAPWTTTNSVRAKPSNPVAGSALLPKTWGFRGVGSDWPQKDPPTQRFRRSKSLHCGAKEIRTPDLFDANEALYQLSYSPWSTAWCRCP